ncbi:MAG: response regulator [Saprospiraceae bacterium]|nr:response regulator [Saprospiraceae bacterium]
MEMPIKLLIVEDEMIIGAKISLQLSNLGYEVTGILPRGEEAILHITENAPDIVLLDINLKGKIDGIETALQIQKIADIPIIYLTANSDENTFNRAKSTRPYAFIAKPFKQLDLQRAIELTISRMIENQQTKIEIVPQTMDDMDENANDSYILSDRIFVKHKEKMVKIFLTEILYIEADRNYSHIFTKNKEYILTITLKIIEEKLPLQHFIRVHRSYIVNLLQIDEVAENHVIIGQKAIPLSIAMREDLLKRLRTL